MPTHAQPRRTEFASTPSDAAPATRETLARGVLAAAAIYAALSLVAWNLLVGGPAAETERRVASATARAASERSPADDALRGELQRLLAQRARAQAELLAAQARARTSRALLEPQLLSQAEFAQGEREQERGVARVRALDAKIARARRELAPLPAEERERGAYALLLSLLLLQR